MKEPSWSKRTREGWNATAAFRCLLFSTAASTGDLRRTMLCFIQVQYLLRGLQLYCRCLTTGPLACEVLKL